jgi:hypothetical protein
MSSFLFQPACVVVDSVPQKIAWVAAAPELDPNLEEGARLLRLFDGDGTPITEFKWHTNPVRQSAQWVFLEEDGTTIQVRQALPGDAVATGFAPYPLPMKLLREKSRNPPMDGQQTELMAAVNPDDHYVLTLILVSPAGVYARYSSNWFEIASANSLGNCYLVGVEDTAVEMYDAHDARGSQVSVKALPTIRDWVPQADVATVQLAEEVVETPGETAANPEGMGQDQETEAITAAGVLVLPTRLDQEDLVQEALEAGAANAEVRWAVRRRLEQLNWTGEFPWN